MVFTSCLLVDYISCQIIWIRIFLHKRYDIDLTVLQCNCLNNENMTSRLWITIRSHVASAWLETLLGKVLPERNPAHITNVRYISCANVQGCHHCASCAWVSFITILSISLVIIHRARPFKFHNGHLWFFSFSRLNHGQCGKNKARLHVTFLARFSHRLRMG